MDVKKFTNFLKQKTKFSRLSRNLSHNLLAQSRAFGAWHKRGSHRKCFGTQRDKPSKIFYECEKATLEQKRVLLQWYEDYLNGIENLGI